MTTQERFEERLLTELRGLVTERPAARPAPRPGWRRRLVATGTVAAALAVAAGVGVPLLTGGGTAAYAVTKNDDGSVTVSVSSLADAAGLEQKLRDAGIPAAVQYIPPGKGCKEQTFTPVAPTPGEHGQIGVQAFGDQGGASHATFTISKSMIEPGRTLVIQTADAGGPTSLMVAWAQGDVQPCELVDASQAAQQPGPAGGGFSTSTGP